jgi:hypothetical protein
VGAAAMSETIEHTPTHRCFGKYFITKFSNSLPRVRRSRRIAGSKTAPRETANLVEPARVLFEQLERSYLLSADISPFVIAFNVRQTFRAGSINASFSWPLSESSGGRGLIS